MGVWSLIRRYFVTEAMQCIGNTFVVAMLLMMFLNRSFYGDTEVFLVILYHICLIIYHIYLKVQCVGMEAVILHYFIDCESLLK